MRIEVKRRYDGRWNVWATHDIEAASRWQVIHVAKSPGAAWAWVKARRVKEQAA